MKNYYFVAPSLPPLVLGQAPEITFEELMYRLQLNLSKKDLEQVKVLRLAIDLYNIRAHYSNQPIDSRGNLNEKELDDALLAEADLPQYVFEFLNQFEDVHEKIGHFFGLLSRFYNEEIAKARGFLKQLLKFQRDVRLVLAALRAKKLKRDVVKEFQFEDFTDPLIAHILAQRDMDVYDPPLEYQDLKNKIQAAGDDPLEQYKAVVSYELDRIEEMTGYPLFSLAWILGYVAKLLLVERYTMLDSNRGKEIVDKFKTG
ncbi:MAG: DUF2764 family protein [Verrucomicrobia bacterium]|nr:DUF2764 family protein [Verrucomicrobiota bacterium]